MEPAEISRYTVCSKRRSIVQHIMGCVCMQLWKLTPRNGKNRPSMKVEACKIFLLYRMYYWHLAQPFFAVWQILFILEYDIFIIRGCICMFAPEIWTGFIVLMFLPLTFWYHMADNFQGHVLIFVKSGKTIKINFYGFISLWQQPSPSTRCHANDDQ